jgi:hypothetical protein
MFLLVLLLSVIVYWLTNRVTQVTNRDAIKTLTF